MADYVVRFVGGDRSITVRDERGLETLAGALVHTEFVSTTRITSARVESERAVCIFLHAVEEIVPAKKQGA